MWIAISLSCRVIVEWVPVDQLFSFEQIGVLHQGHGFTGARHPYIERVTVLVFIRFIPRHGAPLVDSAVIGPDRHSLAWPRVSYLIFFLPGPAFAAVVCTL